VTGDDFGFTLTLDAFSRALDNGLIIVDPDATNPSFVHVSGYGHS
jgi:hypothetical protein